jgi:hypothetical protein
MRRFYLRRDEDLSGVSGSGVVAEGVVFWNGKCVLNWRTKFTSTAHYDDLETLLNVHGHGGKTRLIWFDDKPSEPKASMGEAAQPACSFCSKLANEVKLLTSGLPSSHAYICDECKAKP